MCLDDFHRAVNCMGSIVLANTPTHAYAVSFNQELFRILRRPHENHGFGQAMRRLLRQRTAVESDLRRNENEAKSEAFQN
jgi:hypothetical protein